MPTLSHNQLKKKEGQHSVGARQCFLCCSFRQALSSISGFVKKGNRKGWGSNVTIGHDIYVCSGETELNIFSGCGK